MVIQCELCSANTHSTEELHRHFGSHFTPGQCKNCHKQLILIDGQCYVLQLHNQLNCNQSRLGARNEYSDIGEIKTEIEEFEPEIFPNCTLNASSSGDERKPSDRVKEHVAIEYVEIQPFEMIECGEIKIEGENKLDLVENECVHCGKCFKAHDTLRDHVNKYHLPPNMNHSRTEEECKQYRSDQIYAKATVGKVLRKYFCTICNRYFMDQKKLTKHLSDHEKHADAKLILSSDETVKLPPEQVSISWASESYSAKYKCSILNKRYRPNEILSKHTKCHERAKPVKKLTEEDLTHLPANRIATRKTGEKVLREQKCELCGKYLLTKNTLKKHIREMHETKKKKPEQPRLLSEEESKQYSTNQIFIASSGEIFLRKYQCDICKKYILTKHTMFGHMRDVHFRRPNTKPAENQICATCGKGFKCRKALNSHKLTHSKPQNFICSYCGKGFKNIHALQEHTNVHTGLKPFKCRECDKTFGKKCLLYVHQRVHTGAKPFKCDQEGCERAYAHGSDLNRHLYGAHRIYKRKYECQLCPRIFHEKKLLTKHMLTHD